MRAAAPILIALPAGGLWSLLLAAVGSRARRAAHLPCGRGLRLPVDFLLGGWVIAVCFLLCGLAGAFRPAPLLLVAAALAVAGRWRARGWDRRSAGVMALPAFVLLPVALAPPFFHDALVYHLALPWQALMEGRLAAHPENLFASFPPLAQLIAAGPLASGLERVPALLHLAAFMAAGAALAALARKLGAPRWLALLAGATLPILPALALVPALPAAEGWAVAAIMTSLAVALERRGGCFLAGLLAGIAAAARLQGIPWGALVIAIVALRPAPNTAPRGVVSHRDRIAAVGLALAGWAAGSAPWWLKNLVLLGQPLAPLGWRREGIETLWRDAASHMHLAAGPDGTLRAIGAALLPHVSYLVPLVLAAGMGIFSGVTRGSRLPESAAPRRTTALLGPHALLGMTALLGSAAWWLTGSLPRFLAPTLAALLALAAAAGRGRAGRLAGGLALGTAAALGLAFTAGQMGRWGGPRLALSDPARWPAEVVVNNPAPAFAAARSLPPGPRVLFVGETRGFGFPRMFVAASQHDVSPLRDPVEGLPSAAALRDWLVERGYTHLLVNPAELARLGSTHPVVPWRTPAGRQRFQDLLNLTAPPAVAEGAVSIFALAPPSGG